MILVYRTSDSKTNHTVNICCVCVFCKAPECSINGLEEKLLLFRHENSEQILHRLTEKHDIRDGDLVEVVLTGQSTHTHTHTTSSHCLYNFDYHCRWFWQLSMILIPLGTASVMETKYRPHSLVVQSYRTPTFCHQCGEMLWGLVRQGLKCEGTSAL